MGCQRDDRGAHPARDRHPEPGQRFDGRLSASSGARIHDRARCGGRARTVPATRRAAADGTRSGPGDRRRRRFSRARCERSSRNDASRCVRARARRNAARRGGTNLARPPRPVSSACRGAARRRRPIDALSLPAGARVVRGFLETAGVDAIAEMVDVLAAERSFESAEKAVAAIDASRRKAAEAARIT